MAVTALMGMVSACGLPESNQPSPAYASASPLNAISALPLQVNANRRFLIKAYGSPFFWMGDTAWWLHRLDPDDLAYYLDTRKAQGFNVIQGPILTLDSADYRGMRNDDPANPNEAFFRTIDRIVEETEQRGMYIAPVVMWGHHFNAFRDPDGARRYGLWLANRYRQRDNVIWIVSGEYAIDSTDDFAIAIWRAIGEGLREGSGGRHLITIHGSWSPPALQTSSTFYHTDPWLDFNMIQSSQGGNNGPGAASWTLIETDYQKTPPKPVIDGEATYEGVDSEEGPAWNGSGVRRRAYWSVLAGAFGHTYGAVHVESFDAQWRQALFRDGGASMIHMRRLVESRPMLTRIPDQDLISTGITRSQGSGQADRCERLSPRSPCDVPGHVQAARDAGGSYAMVYIPEGRKSVTIDSRRLSGQDLVAWWYDPSRGTATRIGNFRHGEFLNFTTPTESDWVLVIDDASRNYPAPGSG